MPRHSISRRAAGWTVVALGGLGLVVPLYMTLTRVPGGRGEGLTGTYFETASLLHIPVWLIAGFLLVLVGFAILAPDEPAESDEG